MRRAACALMVALGGGITSPAQGDEGDPPAGRGAVEQDRDVPRETHLGALHGAVGYTFADLTTFVAESDGDLFTAELLPTNLHGPPARLGLGLRLAAVSLSAVGSVAAVSPDARVEVDSLYLWSVDGELGFHFLSGYDLDPYLMLGGGYTSLNGIEDAV